MTLDIGHGSMCAASSLFHRSVAVLVMSLVLCSCSKDKDKGPQNKGITPQQHDQAWKQNNEAGLEELGKGNLDQAEASLLTALKEAEAISYTDQRAAVSLNNLASVYEKKQMYDQCLPLLKRSRFIFDHTLPKDNKVVPVIVANQARILAEDGKFAEAQPIYAEAVSLQDKIHSPDLKDTLLSYAKVLRQLKRDSEAKTMEEMAAAAGKKKS